MGTIASMETDFQNQLELLFENMGNTTFKACRRALPIGMIIYVHNLCSSPISL